MTLRKPRPLATLILFAVWLALLVLAYWYFMIQPLHWFDDTQTQLALIYEQPTHWFELVRRDAIPDALTAMPAPLDIRRPVALGEGVFVAGDHRDSASIQGALVSGRRTADAVLTELGLPAVPREPLPAR